MTSAWSGTVVADHHQYLVADPTAPFDLGEADRGHDGVLAPLDSGTVVGCGAAYGPVELTVVVADVVPGPAGVAAACDLRLPGGVVQVTTLENEPVFRHETDGPALVRLVVEVEGRDERNLGGATPERHTLTLVPVTAAAPRWRSSSSDDVGRFLAG